MAIETAKAMIKTAGIEKFQQAMGSWNKLNQDNRGSFHFDESGKGIIKIMKDGDASTVLHEFSHFLVKKLEQAVNANMGKGTASEDYQKLRDFAGAEGKGKLTKDQHEKIADAFERWLTEGRAPSVKLSGVFNRLKDWMLDTYGSLSNAGIDINDEVRGVFQRMTASDADIKEAQEYYMGKDEAMKRLTDNEEGRKRMEDAKQQAESTAISKHATRLTKLWQKLEGKKADIEKQSKDDLEKNYDEYAALKKAREEGGLNREAFEAEFGKEAADKINETHGKIITDEGKLSAADLVRDNPDGEAPDVDGLMQKIAGAKSIEDATKEEAKVRYQAIARQMDKMLALEKNGIAIDDTSEAGTRYLQATAEELRRTVEAERRNYPDKNVTTKEDKLNDKIAKLKEKIKDIDEQQKQAEKELVQVGKKTIADVKEQGKQNVRDAKAEANEKAAAKLQEERMGYEADLNELQGKIADVKESAASNSKITKDQGIKIAAMRDNAKQFLGDLPEKTATNFQLHLKTLKDLQAKFLKELKSGDKEAALKTRIDQIQQHLVVVESVRLKKELAAVHARLDPTTINAKLKGCDYTGKNVVGHLCNLLGIDGVRQPNKEWTDEAKASNYGSIRQWLSDTQNGLYNFIPNWKWMGK